MKSTAEVTGGDRPRGVRLEIAGGKDLAERQAIRRQVVIAERAGLIGVVEDDQPPASRGRLRGFSDHGQFGVSAPDRPKIIGDLFLQRGDDRGRYQHRSIQCSR